MCIIRHFLAIAISTSRRLSRHVRDFLSTKVNRPSADGSRRTWEKRSFADKRELIGTTVSRRVRPVRRTGAQALLRRALRSLSLEENDNAESAQSDGASVEGEGREARNREAMACDGSGGDRELAQPGPSVTWWNELPQKPDAGGTVGAGLFLKKSPNPNDTSREEQKGEPEFSSDDLR